MNSFSKVIITILTYFLCQFTIGLPISQQPTKVLIQLTDEVTVVLTNHNGVNKESSDVYMTTVGHPDVEMSKKFQSTELKFPEIQFPEVKFPATDAVFEKIYELYEAIINFITNNYIIIIIIISVILIIIIIYRYRYFRYFRYFFSSFFSYLRDKLLVMCGFDHYGIRKNSIASKLQSLQSRQPVE
ncbi:hypothetical protein F8M41_014770 [Gigaspora margarita]|uniref:Uncharacterized protein n=1 Tax=Gigaspora margarita TaxID=4874 RepID=A0A8H3WVF0_GIGMA|nr:hypothetical protein F8M41_014770 [Gigaspora margarita]